VWLRRALGSILVASSVMVAWPRTPASAPVGWVPYSETVFEQAQRAQRPILIDIYADWCLPCVEMDHVTFRHPDVVRALSFVATLRLDVTEEVSEEGERLIARYRVYGAPTILVFDRTGTERSKLRILGFVTPNQFLEIVKQIL
jgi:thiol:disulfide interchange protein DsbD